MIQVLTVIDYSVLQKGVLVHEGDHPAQELVTRKPSKLNRLVVAVWSPEILCSKIVSVTDSVPQWNKEPSSGIEFSISLTSVVFFALTPARIVLTLSPIPSRLNQVHVVSNGREAQQLASDQSYDLVLLDLNLPGTGGLDVLRGIRSKRPDLPVVIVTGASMVEERVRALDAGADDYLAKPFAFAELAARIRAVLRRGSRPARSILQIEDLEVDRVSHTVRRGSHNIDLSPKEFSLLEFLMRHEGQPVSRTAIVEQVWKLNFDTMTNVVDVYINYLRRKVDSGYDRALIRTIRGVGYQIGGNGQHA